MVRTLAFRTAVGTVAGLVAATGLSQPARADLAAPLSKAGTVIGWGTTGSAPAQTLPADLQGTAFTAADAGGGFTVALTASGIVKVLGTSASPGIDIERVPAGLAGATVTQVDASPNNAGAVTSDGRVVVWGQRVEPSEGDPVGADPTDVPAGLTGVTSLALAAYSAAAVKNDGTVVAWGLTTNGETVVPSDLSGVKSIAAASNTFYALKTDGTVRAWGRTTSGATTLPASLSIPGNVVAVAARQLGGLALLSNGKLESWGQNASGTNAVPAGLASKTVVAIAAQANSNLALDSEGTFWSWGQSAAPELAAAPSSLTGASIPQISVSTNHAVALVTKVLEASKPTIAGTAAPGQTLTATPGTFSGAPTGVTGQWRADGADIAGATSSTLAVTTAQAGKRITFASTAAQGSAASVVSVSEPTAIVVADSATSISPTAGTYGRGGGATIKVTNAAGLPVTGTVTVSGAGAPQTVNVSGGSATITLGASLPTGSHTLTATYSGSTALKPSSSSAGYSVAKGKTKRPAFKVSKATTSKKKGKATVTVSTPSGLAKATGKVTVTIKGKSKKTIRTTLSGGKKSITLPKLKKGTYKVTVSYAGDKNYVAQKSSTIKVKVKK